MEGASVRQVLRNERGMALALAVGALVVVGALVAGTLFVGTQEQRVAENARRVETSFGVAEAGANEIVRLWPDSIGSFNAMGTYPGANSTRTLTEQQSRGQTGKYGGTLYRLNESLYLVAMTGQDNRSLSGAIGGGARQRIGILARVRSAPLQIPLLSGLAAQGNVSIAGGGAIDGTDHIPNATWTNCPPLDPTAAGIRIGTGPGDTVSNATNVTGNPPVKMVASMADSTFEKFGGVTYAELAARADTFGIVINAGGNLTTQPATSGTACNKTILTNWGDGLNRAGPCGSYFPIIHLRGSQETTLNGVQGQGVLLVDGNLRIQGSYQFFGVVIIQGYLTTMGGGSSEAHLWGTVMVKNPTDHNISIGGHARVEYSKCAAMQALQAISGPPSAALMRSRSFTTLY
jgi:hypothetical protein